MRYIHFVDYEPIKPRWGDVFREDIWNSCLEAGGAQLSQRRMIERLRVLDEFGVPVSWCVDAWWPHNQWAYFNAELLTRRHAKGDTVTPHWHWMEWDGSRWQQHHKPTRREFLATVRRTLPAFKRLGFQGSIIRSGWCSKTFDDGTPIWPEYRRLGYRGCADFAQADNRWAEGEFLLLSYDNTKTEDDELLVHWEHVPPDPHEDDVLRAKLKRLRSLYGKEFKPVTADEAWVYLWWKRYGVTQEGAA